MATDIILITASLSPKDIQHSVGTRMCSVWWNAINISQIEIGVRGWILFSHVWLSVLPHFFLPFCTCILIAIVLVQLIKLEFFAMQVELKWLRLNKWRRLFHSSRVKFSLVELSASWCVVSMYRLWFFGSKLILTRNQSRATLWLLDTCLFVGLRPLIIILITASLSSKRDKQLQL